MKKDLFNIDHLLGKTKVPEIGKDEEMTKDEKDRILHLALNKKQLHVQKKINIYGGTATLDKISISPLSVTVHLTKIKCKKEWKQPNDQLLVKMKDGTVYN